MLPRGAELIIVLIIVSVVHGQVSMLCRSNERLLACGGCQATCRDPVPTCAAPCRMGCYCPPGLVRNESGHCVPLADCPVTSLPYQQDTSEPRSKDLVCPYNEEYRFCEPCNRTCADPDPLCPAQCSRGCFCKDGLLRNRDGRCVAPQMCHDSTVFSNITCPEHEEFRLCEPCNRTCENPNPICPAQCGRGCFCKDGLLRDKDGRCVSQHMCHKSETSNYVVSSQESDRNCGVKQSYKSCACERTCLEPHATCEKCTGGCFCSDGYVKSPTGHCITIDQCPKEKYLNP